MLKDQPPLSIQSFSSLMMIGLYLMIYPPFSHSSQDFCAGQNRSTITAFFTPYNSIEKPLLRAISNAKQSIYVQTYVLTSYKIVNALIAAQRHGVQVQVLADYVQANQSSNKSRQTKKNTNFQMLKRLQDQGVMVRFESQFQSAHNKIMIFDPYLSNCQVITGSYNFTYSAEHYNAENMLMITANPSVTQQYFENWMRHFAKSIVATFPLPPQEPDHLAIE